MEVLKAPFNYFGGKSKVAKEVWNRFGKVDTYVEPFFGSGAVLLANPNPETTREIVNDLDNLIINCWRALKYSPEEVAYWCDQPINEVELHLNELFLINEGAKRISVCEYDINHYDAEVAGRWLWGMANNIGSKYCVKGPWTTREFKIASETKDYNIKNIKDKTIVSQEIGVGRPRPEITTSKKGINRKNIIKSDFIDHTRPDFNGVLPIRKELYDYLTLISKRFRDVLVCCGSWERIMSEIIILPNNNKSISAIFLDPPYSKEADRKKVYHIDDFSIAHGVRNWCIKNGDNPRYRIALCGYDIEHKELEDLGWDKLNWSTQGGYGNHNKNNSGGKTNKHREVIWFSPHCLKPQDN